MVLFKSLNYGIWITFLKVKSPYLDGHFLTYKVIYIQDVALGTLLLLLHHIINVIIY